jgi:hypothetical protein
MASPTDSSRELDFIVPASRHVFFARAIGAATTIETSFITRLRLPGTATHILNGKTVVLFNNTAGSLFSRGGLIFIHFRHGVTGHIVINYLALK